MSYSQNRYAKVKGCKRKIKTHRRMRIKKPIMVSSEQCKSNSYETKKLLNKNEIQSNSAT
jgi:hypothetical protein